MKTKLLSALFILFLCFPRIYSMQYQKLAVKGRITDEKGSPMSGAAIAVVNSIMGTWSGEDGSYHLELNKPGIYRLKFSFTGYEPVIKEISVSQSMTVDLTLIPRFTRMEEVIVNATRAGEKTPVTFSGVSSEEIRKNNLGQDLPFLLSMTPSLVETSEAGAGIGYTSLRIRGTDGSRINVTIDGIPLNDAESQQVFWVDLPDLASSVDNIQVQRGLGTSSNGAGAFGASVNIQTVSPENQPFAEISSSSGSYNTFKNTVMAGTGLMSDRFSLQLRYSDLKSDGYIKRTGSDNDAFSISGIWKTKKSLLKANFITGREHTGISWWGVPAEMLSVDRRYNPAGEYTDQNGSINYYNNESDNYRQDHYQLIYSLSISEFLSLHSALHYTHGAGYYEEYAEDQLYSDYGLPPVRIDTVNITSTDLIRRKWMRNDFYGLVYSLNYKKNRIDAVLGGGINKYDGDHFGKLIWMRYAGDTEMDHQWYLNKAHKGEISFYGKISYKLDEKLTGYGDIQYRYISYRMKGPDDDLKDITQSHFFSFLNPKAGLYFTISPRQDAYLSFSVGHKEPTRSDFTEASGDEKATPKAESLYDAEAGYLLKTGRADLGINAYGMFYINQLVLTGQLSNVGYPIMTNVGRSYRTGIELTMTIRPLPRLDWNVGTTLSRNKIPGFTEYYTDYIGSDQSTRYVSKNLGTVDIAYSPAITGTSDLAFSISEGLQIHFISKYVGKQYFDNTMSSNRMIDPYFVNNLRIDYSCAPRRIKGFNVSLLVNNIFNNLYESNAYGGLWYEDGEEKTWAYYFPQAGINFLLSAGIKF
jgi:iron complex outermembrane recepter protein